MEKENKRFSCITGLRRSGTSLMMLALRQSGVPILGQKYAVHINFNNPPNDNELYGNPTGYWEMGGITCMTGLRDNHLVLGNNNDVIKVVADCLYYSSPKTINKIIYMKRPARDTMASLVKSKTFDEHQLEAYIQKATVDTTRTLDFIDYIDRPVLVIEYDNLLKDPEKYIKKAIDFLDLGMGDYKRGAKEVNPKLKRTKPLTKDYEGLNELERLINSIK